jgi:hypothetical protein
MEATSGSGGSGDGGAVPTATSEDEGANCSVTLPATFSSTTLLPDPFTKLDGTRITAKADWECRREELRKLFEKVAYGTKPSPPTTVTGTVTNTMIAVTATNGGKTGSFTATVTLPPTGTAPYPAIIYIGGAGADTATIQGEGVALITFNPDDVGAEGNGHGPNQTGAFYSIYSGGSVTGLLAAWAWGTSRIIDVIEQSGGSIIQASAIGVTGCSRDGKAAFTAGAFDERIALTMPIESGTAGVPIWRGIAKAVVGLNGNPSQSLLNAYDEQPWFADAFNAYTGNPTNAPVDTHEEVAMIAPRGLFIMDNPFIGELSPAFGDVAALGGAEVYNALGAGTNISYHSNVASGTHCAVRPEWVAPLKSNIEKFLKKTGNAPGVMDPATNETGNLSQWRTWTTPTLN